MDIVALPSGTALLSNRGIEKVTYLQIVTVTGQQGHTSRPDRDTMRGQKMTLQPDKHNWGFHPQTPKVYRFWVSGKGDTTSSDVIYATESIGRQLWPGLAGNYGPAGRGKRLYAPIEIYMDQFLFLREELVNKFRDVR